MNIEDLNNLKTGDRVYAIIVYTDNPGEPDFVEFSGQTEVEIFESSKTMILKDSENNFDWPLADFEEPWGDSKHTLAGTVNMIDSDYDVIVTDDKDVFNQLLDQRILLSEEQHLKRVEAFNKGRV